MKVIRKYYRDGIEYRIKFTEPPYDYSYKFVWKSVSTMKTDWWSFSTERWWQFKSNGITRNSTANAEIYRLISLSNAKTITVSCNCYVMSWTNYWQFKLGVVDTIGTNWLDMFISADIISSSRWYGIDCFGTTTAQRTELYWSYNPTLTINLNNKTASISNMGTNININLTDSNIQSIRNSWYFQIYFKWQSCPYLGDITIYVTY